MHLILLLQICYRHKYKYLHPKTSNKIVTKGAKITAKQKKITKFNTWIKIKGNTLFIGISFLIISSYLLIKNGHVVKSSQAQIMILQR